MRTQINIAFVTQLKRFLLGKLKQHETTFRQIKGNEKRLEEVIGELINEITIVKNNVKVAELPELMIFEKLRELYIFIQDLKASPESLDVVIETLAQLHQYYTEKISAFEKKGSIDFYPIELWLKWQSIKNLLGERATPYELFVPFAVFSEEEESEFQDLEIDHVRVKAEQAVEDYKIYAKVWLESNATEVDIEPARQALLNMMRILDYLLEIKVKSRLSFQGYFLALRGRLFMAYQNDQADLIQPERHKVVKNIIEHSLQVLDTAYLSPLGSVPKDVMKELIWTFLIVKDVKPYFSTQEVQEVLHRFNIMRFFEKAKDAINEMEHKRKALFNENQQTLLDISKKLLSTLDEIRLRMGESDTLNMDTRLGVKMNNLIENLKQLEKISHEKMLPVLNVLDTYLIHLQKPNKIFTLSEIKELTGLVCVLMEYIQHEDLINESFVEQATIQAQNFYSVIKGTQELLPVKWHVFGDITKMERLKNILRKTEGMLNTIRRDYQELAEHRKYNLSNEAILEHFKSVVLSSSNTIGILIILDKRNAAEILDVFRMSLVEKAELKNFVFTEEEVQHNVRVLQSLEVFVELLEKGHVNPDDHLKPIRQELKLFEQQRQYQEMPEYASAKLSDGVKRSQLAVSLLSTQDNILASQKDNFTVSYRDSAEFKEDVEHIRQTQENNDVLVIEQDKQVNQISANNYQILHVDLTDRDHNEDLLLIIGQIYPLDMQFYADFDLPKEDNPLIDVKAKAIKQLLKTPDSEHDRLELKRVSHTIKGNSRQVGLEIVGEVSEICEFTLKNRILENLPINTTFLKFHEQMLDMIIDIYRQIEAGLRAKQASVTIEFDRKLFNELKASIDITLAELDELIPEGENPAEQILNQSKAEREDKAEKVDENEITIDENSEISAEEVSSRINKSSKQESEVVDEDKEISAKEILSRIEETSFEQENGKKDQVLSQAKVADENAIDEDSSEISAEQILNQSKVERESDEDEAEKVLNQADEVNENETTIDKDSEISAEEILSRIKETSFEQENGKEKPQIEVEEQIVDHNEGETEKKPILAEGVPFVENPALDRASKDEIKQSIDIIIAELIKIKSLLG